MPMEHVIGTFAYGKGKRARFYSLPALEEAGIAPVSRLPVSLRIVLESVLRNCDGKKVTEEDVTTLARWNAKHPAEEEIPFVVARIVLQDFTGVPLLVDLAAMRGAVAQVGQDPKIIEPLVPVDLVVDHSVQVDFAGIPEAIELNLEYEFKRNRERSEVGPTSVQDLWRGASWHRHRASGEFGIPCSRCGQCFLSGRRNLLSRHIGWNRFAYHDDQWTWHRRVGSRWDRSGSRHAWPAGLFPYSGSGGSASFRQA